MPTRRGKRLIRNTTTAFLLLLCHAFPLMAGDPAPSATSPQIEGYETRPIEGWTVRINSKLLKERPEKTESTIELLTAQLREIVRLVPERPVAHLRRVAIWINPEYPGKAPGAEYHPDAGWLREHGRDVRMARCVELTNVRIFDAECRRMPCFVLHELAHAYHDQVLGFDQPDVVAAYKRALASKRYDAVERWNGRPPNTIERAYAMTDHKEYFAESTEAFFGRNDFFPFTRDELRRHDVEMYRLLVRLWRIPGPTTENN